MQYTWQIPETLNITDTRFQFLAQNKTLTGNGLSNNGTTFKSPGFFITSKDTSSTSNIGALTISTTPTSTTMFLPTASSDTSTSNAGQLTGLSTGAKAGIGIGCALIAILAVLAALFLIKRSRNRKVRGGNDAGLTGGFEKSELDAAAAEKAKRVSEVYGPQRMELNAERGGNFRPAELGQGG